MSFCGVVAAHCGVVPFPPPRIRSIFTLFDWFEKPYLSTEYLRPSGEVPRYLDEVIPELMILCSRRGCYGLV